MWIICRAITSRCFCPVDNVASPAKVLDEATSSLDNQTEKAVMEAVNDLSGSMTIVMIAHRLSTLERCDTVFELHPGGEIKVREYSELAQS